MPVGFWAATPRLLPAMFGASATSTAVAALSLAERAGHGGWASRPLARVGLVAGAAELTFSLLAERRWRAAGVAAPMTHGVWAGVYQLGARALGIVLPLGVHAATAATGRRSRLASLAASLGTLAGGYALRAALVFAGHESGRRPRDYFRFTQPAVTSALPTGASATSPAMAATVGAEPLTVPPAS